MFKNEKQSTLVISLIKYVRLDAALLMNEIKAVNMLPLHVVPKGHLAGCCRLLQRRPHLDSVIKLDSTIWLVTYDSFLGTESDH